MPNPEDASAQTVPLDGLGTDIFPECNLNTCDAFAADVAFSDSTTTLFRSRFGFRITTAEKTQVIVPLLLLPEDALLVTESGSWTFATFDWEKNRKYILCFAPGAIILIIKFCIALKDFISYCF